MTEPSLRRYTNLPALIHILHSKHLTMLSPRTWDDRNDAFFMEEYQTKTNAKTVLALCFAETAETYHHWRVFSPGADGVCLEFDKKKLRAIVERQPQFKCRSVTYKTIEDAKTAGIETGNLPFVKRYPFRDEKEFRLIFVDMDREMESQNLDIGIDVIKRVTLSPWMHKSLSESVKASLKSINGCNRVKIYRSTLVDNEGWKRIANIDLE